MNWPAESLDPVSSSGELGLVQATPNYGPLRKRMIKVLLVDDHPVVRHGIRACLRPCPCIAVIGEAANGREALDRVRELSPDLVLMDVEMPEMDGLITTEILRRQCPKIKVVILSMHNHSEYVMRIVKSGASGYVLKGAPAAELVRAIEEACAGGTFFSPEVALTALDQIARRTSDWQNGDPLSLREREVLVAIAEGLSNKQIACRLGVGIRTIETHRERITHKLNIRTVAGLTKFAIANGLVPVPQKTDRLK
jgi:DNA-binding NarL/FixJ family response regulator